MTESGDQSIDVGRKRLSIKLKWAWVATVVVSLLATVSVAAWNEREDLRKRLFVAEGEIANLKNEMGYVRSDVQFLIRMLGGTPVSPPVKVNHAPIN